MCITKLLRWNNRKCINFIFRSFFIKNEKDDNKLHLIIGEDIPNDAPKEFSKVALYIRDKEKILNLYTEVSLPYLINHSEFLGYDGDPRYPFMEGYDEKNKISRYICMIKPFGSMKGVYCLLDGNLIKIKPINVLYELQNDVKSYKLVNEYNDKK